MQTQLTTEQIEIMQTEQEQIFNMQLTSVFDLFNECNFISNYFINSNEIHYLIEYYNQNYEILKNNEEDPEFTNIMDNISLFHDWQFGSLRANYKSRLYLKLWLKKLVLYIW